MSLSVEALAGEVLGLPSAERSRLLDQVIASLDADRQRDLAWDALAAKRDAECDADPSQLLDGPSVVARLRAELA